MTIEGKPRKGRHTEDRRSMSSIKGVSRKKLRLDRRLRSCIGTRIRLTHASASFQQLANHEINQKSVHRRKSHANDFRVSLLHLIRHGAASND